MSEIRSRINQALKESLKTKEPVSTSTIRLIMAALKDRDIAARGKGETEGVSDEEILAMLQTMVKQRRESISLYEQGGRLELAEREAAEIAVIQKFLPEQMDDAAMRKAISSTIADIEATSIKEMGAVMAALRSHYAGKMDFGKAAAAVKAELS